MNRLVILSCLMTGVVIMALTFPSGFVAVTVAVACSAVVILLMRRNFEDSDFLVQLFLVALMLRMGFGTLIHIFELREFFGGDALTYDWLGRQIVDVWYGYASPNDFFSQRAMSTGTPGWGMHYLTAFIYLITGRDILAAQFFCAVIGAATVPLVYNCAFEIFGNRRVGKTAALFVAVFPAFIIWSGQLLKDGVIIFLLALAVSMILRLQRSFSLAAVVILILSLFGILSVRFYIFYMVAASAAGSFIVGQGNSAKEIGRRLGVLVVIGLALTYLGVLRTASDNLDKFASLDKVQQSRLDLARSADSGFGQDADVSTTEGALSIIPLGFTYLMLAPFPWQVGSLRQTIALPETLVWWALLPFMVVGIVYTIRYKLRAAIPILIFTLMLTLSYSIFQANVGTAYRQRTQIQTFLFMFIAVGWTVFKERRENVRLERLKRRAAQLGKSGRQEQFST